MTNKIAPAIALMTEYIEEGYDAELIGRLNRRELAGLIVCPLLMGMIPEGDKYHSAAYHHDRIRTYAKEAFIELCLQEMMRNA